MDPANAKLKPGESVWCRLQSPEPGGYLVTLTPSGIEGFLPSHDPIDMGRVVPATFVCMSGERALLTYAFVMGTTERVQVSTASDQENAFSVWADSYPDAIRLRRAVDLVMPPFSSSPILLKLGEKSAYEFFGSLESAQFTGCVKVFCQKRLSRAAVIFHHGRVVGSVYTTKLISEPYPFEVGLRRLLEDMKLQDAELEMYDLPGDLVLSMSALFLGYTDQRKDTLNNLEYAEEMLAHFATRKETACFSLNEQTQTPCALGFVSDGEFIGMYVIAERTFGKDKVFMRQVLDKHATSRLEAYILPSAMTTDSVRFGYSLTSAQFAT
jgi:hypothetical protein